MQPDELIRQDHEKMRQLFQQFEMGGGDKSALAQELVMELSIHAQVEEQLYYPQIRQLPGMAEKIGEGVQEHQEVKALLSKLEGATEPQLDGLIPALRESVEHHAQEEEKEILPRTQELGNAEALGQQMADLRQQLNAGIGL